MARADGDNKTLSSKLGLIEDPTVPRATMKKGNAIPGTSASSQRIVSDVLLKPIKF